MLANRLNDIFLKYNIQPNQVMISEIMSLLSSEPKIMMDTIDLTIFERPFKISSAETWSPFDESPPSSEKATEPLSFDEVTDTDAEIGRYDDLGILTIFSHMLFQKVVFHYMIDLPSYHHLYSNL